MHLLQRIVLVPRRQDDKAVCVDFDTNVVLTSCLVATWDERHFMSSNDATLPLFRVD